MGREANLTVTTTPQKIMERNNARSEASIQNNGAVTMYLGTNEEVASSGTRKGRQLAAGVLETLNKNEDLELIKEPMYAVVAAGTCDIWIWEA